MTHRLSRFHLASWGGQDGAGAGRPNSQPHKQRCGHSTLSPHPAGWDLAGRAKRSLLVNIQGPWYAHTHTPIHTPTPLPPAGSETHIHTHTPLPPSGRHTHTHRDPSATIRESHTHTYPSATIRKTHTHTQTHPLPPSGRHTHTHTHTHTSATIREARTRELLKELPSQ